MPESNGWLTPDISQGFDLRPNQNPYVAGPEDTKGLPRLPGPSNKIQDIIIAQARDAGLDPAFALAVAQRESQFNPNARASKTIQGTFQMTKGLRDKYGIGDSSDPEVQAKGWGRYVNEELKAQMTPILGREPTNNELYYGHHFGGVRAAHMVKDMDPNTSVSGVFSRQEMEGNPHIAKAGTVGNLLKGVGDDMDKRYASFGGAASPTTSSGSPASTGSVDYTKYGSGITDTAAPAQAAPMGQSAQTAIAALAKPRKQQEEIEDSPMLKLAPPPDFMKGLKTAIQAQQRTPGLPPLPGLQPQQQQDQGGLYSALAPLMGG